MCGMIGYFGAQRAYPFLMQGLKRLQYRGYDSAGICLVDHYRMKLVKATGKLYQLEREAIADGLDHDAARLGIGHTRWATHGEPTETNAHPHVKDRVVLAHNGIIENHRELKELLMDQGYVLSTQTDTEVFLMLIDSFLQKKMSFLQAVAKSFTLIEGSSSMLVLYYGAQFGEQTQMIGIKRGSPLVLGRTEGEILVASDTFAFPEHVRSVVYLEDDQLVHLYDGDGGTVYHVPAAVPDKEEKPNVLDAMSSHALLDLKHVILEWKHHVFEKSVDEDLQGGDQTFMLQEIFAQPWAIVNTLRDWGLQKQDPATVSILEKISSAEPLIIIACGSSFHAALLAKYWFEEFAQISVQVESANEFRYRNPVLPSRAVVVGISQSGETADTISALRYAKSQGVKVIGLSNVKHSTLSQHVHHMFYTDAGREIGVASTKTFSTQLTVLLALVNDLSPIAHKHFTENILKTIADSMHHYLRVEKPSILERVSKVMQASQYASIRGFFFIGRGYSYPLALEGSLKLMELAYEHAHGYSAGELKHGPIAMLDENFLVVVICPRDQYREKTLSNAYEVKARKAKIIAIGSSDDQELQSLSDIFMPLPCLQSSMHPSLAVFFIVPILQLLSYYRAVFHGYDVDQPRNLAKSVTVE